MSPRRQSQHSRDQDRAPEKRSSSGAKDSVRQIAVIADIHSNLTALNAVLNECKQRGITRFFCLGDIVGYSAHPQECIEAIRALTHCRTVLGNHDASVVAGEPDENMNPLAAAGIRYSVKHLTPDAREWLRARQLVKKIGTTETIVHASLVDPGAWHYVTERREAKFSFLFQNTPICFFGHTHRPAIYSTGDSPQAERIHEWKFRFDPRGHYMINPGSVGQSRSGDPRAHCVIYDRAEMTVEYLHLDYDIEAEIEAIQSARLPAVLGERLLHGL